MIAKDRVTIICIGINDYDHLTKLRGTHEDVRNIKNILVENTETALFSTAQFKEHYDVNIDSFRKIISEYSITRTAPNDILILYFSGHGSPVGNSDFGFLLKDTQIIQEKGITHSLSVIKFKDIIETLSQVNVDPVIIIDACFSGQAGAGIEQVLDQMRRDVQAETGSNYALLCSSNNISESTDTEFGGNFSKLLVQTSLEISDFDNTIEYITLSNLYSILREKIEQNGYDIAPRLFIGGTLPEFPFIKNKNYKPIVYQFNSAFKNILEVFWNNGDPSEYSTEDLRQISCTVQTTYSKLSYSPGWGLIDKSRKGFGKLTPKGIDFIKGNITIPLEIIKNNRDEDIYTEREGTRQVHFNEF